MNTKISLAFLVDLFGLLLAFVLVAALVRGVFLNWSALCALTNNLF